MYVTTHNVTYAQKKLKQRTLKLGAAMVLLAQQRLRLLLWQPIQLGAGQVTEFASVSTHEVHLHLLQVHIRHFGEYVLVQLIDNTVNDLTIHTVVGTTLLEISV